MVNMGELFAHDRIGDQDMELVQMNDRELQDYSLEEGDLLFARQSLVLEGAGKCSLVQKLSEPTTFESHLIRVRLDGGICHPTFYYYYFRSRFSPIRAIVQQCAQAGIKASDLARVRVAKPSLAVQNRIAETLSQYDDLIENNRRRIQLLEQASRLFYKEWFVRLRFPGHEHVKIIDGVPEGWEKPQIGELSEYLSRGITPEYDDDAPSIVINQKCIRDRLVNLELARHQSKEIPQSKLVRPGDVLVNSTGEGTLGRTAQLIEEMQNCTVDSHITIVRPSDRIGKYYFGMCLTSLEGYLATMGRGATNQTELARSVISEIEILSPRRAIMEEFEGFAGDVFGQIRNLSTQNKKLALARDLLLPRLMNGEIAA